MAAAEHSDHSVLTSLGLFIFVLLSSVKWPGLVGAINDKQGTIILYQCCSPLDFAMKIRSCHSVAATFTCSLCVEDKKEKSNKGINSLYCCVVPFGSANFAVKYVGPLRRVFVRVQVVVVARG